MPPLEEVVETAYITPKGMVKIEAEVERLKGDKRFEIIERLQETRTGGDGLDNTEYIAAQEELAALDGRIQDLEEILRHAELIVPGEVDGIIRLGSTVVVQEEGFALETYTLVGPAEANQADHRAGASPWTAHSQGNVGGRQAKEGARDGENEETRKPRGSCDSR